MEILEGFHGEYKLILMKKYDGNQYKKWGLKRNKKGVKIDGLLNFDLNFSWNCLDHFYCRELYGASRIAFV